MVVAVCRLPLVCYPALSHILQTTYWSSERGCLFSVLRVGASKTATESGELAFDLLRLHSFESHKACHPGKIIYSYSLVSTLLAHMNSNVPLSFHPSLDSAFCDGTRRRATTTFQSMAPSILLLSVGRLCARGDQPIR